MTSFAIAEDDFGDYPQWMFHPDSHLTSVISRLPRAVLWSYILED